MEEIKEVPPETIAYVDETGIDTYLFREYGYAPRGEQVMGLVSGRRYARTGIVAAQLGDKIISPMQYSGTMNGDLFEAWFEKQLLPSLSEETVIVMDNASFHRKARLRCIAQRNHRKLTFLPPYSPELNPIEHFWAWLKRKIRKILSNFSSFNDALSYTFKVR